MNARVTYGLACAIVGIGVRLLTFTFGWDMSISTQFYLLIILISVFLGIRSVGIRGEEKYGKLLKGGMQSGVITTLMITGYTYVHYTWVDINFMAGKISERLQLAKEAGLSAERLLQEEQNAEFIFSAATHSTLTLAGFLIATLLYALLTTFLYQKVALFSRL